MVALAARVQLPAGANVPVELVVKLTDPVGVVGVAEVSVTVAEQLVPWFTTTDDALQLTDMVVGWTETPTGRLNLGLPVFIASPIWITLDIYFCIELHLELQGEDQDLLVANDPLTDTIWNDPRLRLGLWRLRPHRV